MKSVQDIFLHTNLNSPEEELCSDGRELQMLFNRWVLKN